MLLSEEAVPTHAFMNPPSNRPHQPLCEGLQAGGGARRRNELRDDACLTSGGAVDPPPGPVFCKGPGSVVSVLNNGLKDFHYPFQVPQMLHFPLAALIGLSLQPQSTTSLFQQSRQHQNKEFRSPGILRRRRRTEDHAYLKEQVLKCRFLKLYPPFFGSVNI